MPENRWYIESKMRGMSPKRVTLSTLHGFRIGDNYKYWSCHLIPSGLPSSNGKIDFRVLKG